MYLSKSTIPPPPPNRSLLRKKYCTMNFMHIIHGVCQIQCIFTNQCHCLHLHSQCLHQFVLVNFSLAMFSILSTHDNSVMQAIVWLPMVWLSASYANLRKCYIFKQQIWGKISSFIQVSTVAELNRHPHPMLLWDPHYRSLLLWDPHSHAMLFWDPHFHTTLL